MKDREYLRLKRQIQEEYRRKLDALDLVWQVANGCSPPSGKSKTKTSTQIPGKSLELAAGERPTGKIAEIVGKAVKAMNHSFSTKDVHIWIAANAPDFTADRSTISHALKRLPAIRIVQKGQGKRPSFYEKIMLDLSAQIEQQSETSQHDAIRQIVRESQIDPSEFRRDVLGSKYEVEKLTQLTYKQAEKLLSELRSQVANNSEIAH